MRWTVLVAVLVSLAVVTGGWARTADATAQVYSIDVHTGRMTWLIEGREPSFSPDARRIAYVCRRALCTIAADGSDPKTVVALEGWVMGPVWSPDGTKIAFSTPTGVSVVGADGSGLHTAARGARSPSWSPDSRRLVFEAGLDANDSPTSTRTARADGTPLRRIVKGNGVWEPKWSPSGTAIVYSAGVYDPSFGIENRRVWLVNVSSGRRQRYGWGHEPSWSPRGERIAFTRGLGVYVASLEHPPARRLAMQGSLPAWSADGRAIAYWHRLDLTVVSPSGQHKRIVIRFSNHEEGPGSRPSWSPEESTIVTSGTPSGPSVRP